MVAEVALGLRNAPKAIAMCGVLSTLNDDIFTSVKGVEDEIRETRFIDGELRADQDSVILVSVEMRFAIRIAKLVV